MTDIPDEAQEMLAVYADVFGTVNGRAVLQDLTETFSTPTIIDGEDGRLTKVPAEYRPWVKEGERNVVNKIKQALELQNVVNKIKQALELHENLSTTEITSDEDTNL